MAKVKAQGASKGIVQQPTPTPAPEAGERLTRKGTMAGRMGEVVTAANRWRENYNPLRDLDMRRVVELLDMGQRGDTAMLQWTFRRMERQYPTMSALISRCEAPLLNFGWEVKVKEQLPKIANRSEDEVKAMAEAQQATLREAYDRVDNLKAAIKHLHLAEFRGYAHLQKWRDESGMVTHLEPLHQWCVCRDGLEGNWWWNPDSKPVAQPAQTLGLDYCIGGERLPEEDFIIRETERPIDEIGLVNFVRASLAEKDADGFLEIYGIPGGVVTMPGNVPQGKEGEYEAAARAVAEGGSGAIPNGASYTANDGPRGVDPFTPRLRHLDEQVVMAGTGGMLTMLAESGSGNLAGGAHSDTFDEIAVSRAEKISECLQEGFDEEVLEREHPGEPCLVYFVLTPVEAGADESLEFTRTMVQGLLRNPTLAPLVMNLINLKETVRACGVVVNEEYEEPYLKDGTGEGVSGEEVPPTNGNEGQNDGWQNDEDPEEDPNPKGPVAGKVANRDGAPGAKLEGNGLKAFGEALAEDLKVLKTRIEGLLDIEDPEVLRQKAGDMAGEIDALKGDILKMPKAAQALASTMVAAMFNGMTEQPK